MELLKFIAKRLLSGLLVMVGVSVVIFLIFNALPVNSARMTLGQRADMASVEAIEKEFRLNLPLYQRMIYYFNDLAPISFNNLEDTDAPSYLNPDEVSYTALFSIGKISVVAKLPYLGKSLQTRRAVSEMIRENIFPTFMLAVSAMIIASIFGILFGVIAAIKQHTAIDNFLLIFSTLGISQPAQFAGLIIAMIFGSSAEGRGMRFLGVPAQARLPVLVIARQQLIARAARDAEAPAKLAEAGGALLGQQYKFMFLFHYSFVVKGHSIGFYAQVKTVYYVPGQLYTMSLVHTKVEKGLGDEVKSSAFS